MATKVIAEYERNPPKISLDKLQPHPKQREVIEDNHRFKVVIFGRQSGKSWLAKRMLLDEAINKHSACIWLSSSVNNSRQHWESLLALLFKAGFPIKTLRQSTREIYFYGGGFIHVRTVGEDNNLRGATMDFIVCDEACFYPDGENVWTRIIQPMVTTTGGRIVFTTTPNGWDWVYKLYQRGLTENEYYKSWTMPSWESPYQDKGLLEEIKANVHPLVWRTEYGAEFIPDGGGIFTNVFENAVTPMLYQPKPDHVYVMGIDWGVEQDYTVAVIFDKHTREMVYAERFTSIGTDEQISRVMTIIGVWQPEKIYVERNSVGAFMFRLLRERYAAAVENQELAESKIIGLHLDNELKRRLIERFAVDLEYGRIKLLDKDCELGAELISEMSTFERVRTDRGVNHTYQAARGTHDDFIMAAVFAYHAVPEFRAIVKPKTAVIEKTERRSPFKNVNRGR